MNDAHSLTRTNVTFTSSSPTRVLIIPVSVSGIIPFVYCLILCSDGKMQRRRELNKDRTIRVVLFGASVIFSICNISSSVSLCMTGIPASSADDVINFTLRRMMAVSCDFSSSFLLSFVVGGVDMECMNVSCVRDLNRLVSLLLVDDPTCGVRRGRSLTLVRFRD